MNTTAEPKKPRYAEIDLLQLANILWHRKFLIIMCVALAALIGGYYAFQVASPLYAAKTRLELQVHGQQVVDLESVISGVSTDQNAINTELKIISSRPLIERLVNQLDLTNDPEFNTELQSQVSFSFDYVKDRIKGVFGLPTTADVVSTPEQIFRRVTGRVFRTISVAVEPKTYLFDIIVTTADPQKSALFGNTLAQIYLDYQIEVKFEATKDAVDWLSVRTSELEADLKKLEDEIKQTATNSGSISLEALEALNVRSSDLKARLSDTEATVDETQATLETARSAVEREDWQLAATVLDAAITNRFLNGALAGEERARNNMLIALNALITRSDLALKRAETQKILLTDAFAEIQTQIDEQSANLVKLTQMTREAEATRVLYETFLNRLKETSVQVGIQQADALVLAPAIRGTLVAPRKTLIVAMSMILGGLIGVVLSLTLYLRQNGFKSAEDLEQETNLAVIGQIPILRSRRRSNLLTQITSNSTSATAEAVRNLRTSIMMSNIDTPPQVIMLTSSIPGEGKTSQAIMLAHSFSGIGKRVLLMEGDVRRRTLDSYFSGPEDKNLVSVLNKDMSFEDAILHNEDLGIDVLVGGRSSVNAADVFSSDRFKNTISMVREKYDIVIIDTPPVLAVSDARIIAPLADAIIFMVKWDSTQKMTVLEGIRQFTAVGEQQITGLALTQLNIGQMKRYGNYNAAYGYGYYGR